MSPSSASNFFPTLISIGKKHLKILLTFFKIAEVKKTSFGTSFSEQVSESKSGQCSLG